MRDHGPIRKYRLVLVLMAIALLPSRAFARDNAGQEVSGPYQRQVVGIPMRDGVVLHTVILVPDSASALPILLTRTPYDADDIAADISQTGASAPFDGFAAAMTGGPYIRVIQDVRGQNRSGGVFEVTRPLSSVMSRKPATDESTDAFDTVEWLVHHVTHTNAKVGLIGTSYDGFEVLMGLVNPHPAIRVAVAINPMVDGWQGDDWFHHGAFRQLMIPAIWSEGKSASQEFPWNAKDHTQAYLRDGSAGAFAQVRGLNDVKFWHDIVTHPAYDEFWQARAVQDALARHPFNIPLMLVHGLWDQEDIYGGLAVWRALRKNNTRPANLFLTVGPWHHAQALWDGSHTGDISWGSDTAQWWRKNILTTFLGHYLGNTKENVHPVTAYDTGIHQWEYLADWPATAPSQSLYLKSQGKLTFTANMHPGETATYVSDPADPVPFLPKVDGDIEWDDWLTQNQNFLLARKDVLTFKGEVLDKQLTIRGVPWVHLAASTSGTDVDWVVKIIDVSEDGSRLQPISMDIFRGRYRRSISSSDKLESNKFLSYDFALPPVYHTFLKGHKIAVQIQSTLFPLYDRNPQQYVGNIFQAKPEDYKSSIETIGLSGSEQSRIDLPISAY